jgi:hypothetical protein
MEEVFLMNIQIKSAGITLQAELYDTPTAQAIKEALPITSSVNRWGDEIYFAIDVSMPLEADSRDVVEPGQLGFWPTGNAFCIFFGPTPASQADECRAASNVNVFGAVTGDLSKLWDIADSAPITIEST